MSTTAFTYGGTTLTTFGSITLIDDYLSTPNRRASDPVIPFRDGTVFVQKFYSSRTFVFGITISSASAQALEGSIDTLRALIAPRAEQTLSMTMEDGSTRTISASCNKSLDIRRETPRVARVVLELTASKPYWRSSTLTDTTTTINASPKTFNLTNGGKAQERDPGIVIDGPFSAITIACTTTGTSLTYTGAIGASETVTIGTAATGEYTAVLSTGSANVIGNLTHTGDSALLTLNPGVNAMSVTSTGGDNSGTVRVYYYAPFL